MTDNLLPLDEIRPDPTGFEPLTIEIDDKDIWYLRKINGQIIIDEQAKQSAKEYVDTQKRISETKARLTALSEDIVQDLAGEVVPNVEERKAEFISLHNELRVLTGLEPRELK